MSQSTITKSIRLTHAENDELTHLSENSMISEAALMKRWISQGIQSEKLEMAILAYSRQQVDLRAGAAIAGVSYNRFMREVEKRHIVILDDPRFLEELFFLSAAFDLPELQRAAEKTLGSTEHATK